MARARALSRVYAAKCVGLRAHSSTSRHCQVCATAASAHACHDEAHTRMSMRLAGVQVVTGGLGGLGLRAAALLIARRASQVVLCSRSGRVAKDGATGQWYLLLFETLACVVQASDVADAAESRLLFGRPCNHLLHAAGT